MKLILSLLVSFIALRGFRFELTRTGLELRNTESFAWLLLFLFFSRICYRSLKSSGSRLKWYAALFGVIISCFSVVGKTLSTLEYFSWIWANPHNLLHFLNMLFSHALLYYSAAFLIFPWLDRQTRPETSGRSFSFTKKILIIWAVLLLFYIPWWLYCYPGVISDDSGVQIKDALSVNTLSDWNPAFVTLLIRMIMVPVMRLTGSITTGVGICTFLQMLIVTFVFALSFERVCRYIRSIVLKGLAFLFFAVYPVNNIYSVTMWKDILFSICFLGFMLCLDSCSEDEAGFFSRKRSRVMLFLTLLLMPLLRHNGIFITAMMAIYLPFRFRNFRKKAAAICCGALILFAGWKFLLLPALHTQTIPSGEYLSVPLQQIARVLTKHHEEMDPELLQEAGSFFTIPEIWTQYSEKTVDPVKKYFDLAFFQKNRAGFFSLWSRLGREFPVEYLEAYLHNNYGYWFPETNWWISMSGVQMNDAIESLQHTPILRLPVIEKIDHWYLSEQYEKVPVLPLLFKPGACFWLWVFCGIYCLYQNRRKFILFLPGFLLWLIIQWSPVYCEYRYVYGLFTCLPLLLASALTHRPEDIQGAK